MRILENVEYGEFKGNKQFSKVYGKLANSTDVFSAINGMAILAEVGLLADDIAKFVVGAHNYILENSATDDMNAQRALKKYVIHALGYNSDK